MSNARITCIYDNNNDPRKPPGPWSINIKTTEDAERQRVADFLARHGIEGQYRFNSGQPMWFIQAKNEKQFAQLKLAFEVDKRAMII